MTEKELLKLKRSELLEIMLAQSREIDSLREQLAEAQRKLEDKTIKIRRAGSLAEASLQLTRVFEEAQKAADLYVYNMRRATQRAQEAAAKKYSAADNAAASEEGSEKKSEGVGEKGAYVAGKEPAD